VRRAGRIAGVLLLLLGLFWTGRESTHGLSAFWEHWWCPLPVAFILVGLIGFVLTRRPTPA